MSIMLNNNIGFKWFNNNKYYVKGYLYDETNKLYKNEELINYFDGVNNAYEFREKLEEANGVFDVIVKIDELIFAAVDRIRSLPLFYSIYNSNLILSDNANSLKDEIGALEMDNVSVNEFLLAEYVTNEDTLYEDIKQIQAGEYIVFDEDLKELNKYSYYKFEHKDLYDISEEDLIEKLDEVHVEVFKRLIESLDGRTAVIPLSGGFDSRLVAVMLKRLGYENVICYSYGKEGNLESKISKIVAEYLGYKWIFIPYTNDLWYKWHNSKERMDYYKYGSNLVSLAHVQDWPAVMKLKNKVEFPKDSIFIPGHSADFLEGSHIPKMCIQKNTISNKELVDSIYKKHYSLWDWKDKFNQYNTEFEKKIYNNIKIKDTMTSEEAASLFEEWDWKERQAKFICNSVRVYEYFGYEWRLPLWDNELMDYWSKIDLQKRYMRKLYEKYDDQYFKELNRKISEKSIVAKVLYKAKNNRITRKISKRVVYRNSPLQMYGICGYEEFNNLKLDSQSINSLIVKTSLDEMK